MTVPPFSRRVAPETGTATFRVPPAGATSPSYPDDTIAMHSNDTLWYRLGYTLERARGSAPDLPSLLRQGAPDSAGRDNPRDNPGDGADDGKDGMAVGALVLGGAGALASRLLRAWPRRHAPGVLGLAAAGASGAAAGLLVELVGPLLRGEAAPAADDDELAASVLSGTGRGLAYGAVAEPRLPGPAVLRGFLYGTLEYAIAPWGGLPGLLGSASPHRKLPVVSRLLEPGEDDEADYLDFVIFGLALGLLYGTFVEKRGTSDEA